MKILTLLAFGLALAIPPAVNGYADDLPFAQTAQKAFSDPIKEFEIPGLVVGVTYRGKHEFYTTGVASRAGSHPVTPDTLFELGSISKIINVTLAAFAEQHGKLSLDDKVAHYLCADTCKIGSDMTLMDLATHHSGGLPLQVPDSIHDTDGLIDWLKTWQPPHPGTRSYSNISIGLLGHITAQVFGTTYADAAQTLLFPKLGMNNTWINVPEKAMSAYAFGYDRETDEAIRVTPGVLDAEAYGVKSSARDMLRLLDAQLGNATISPELAAAIHRTQAGQFKTSVFTQGMIWEQYPWPVNLETIISGNGYDFILHPQPVERITPAPSPQKRVILNKTGSTNGFGGYVAVLPDENLGIVMLANRNFPIEARVKATYALIEALVARHAAAAPIEQ